MKLKKLYIVLLVISLFGCNRSQLQKKYFCLNLNKLDQNDISYQFETYGLKKLEFKLVEYKKNNRKNSIPLGSVSYAEIVEDNGLIEFEYALSNFDKKVILLDLNSNYFKSSGDTKILDTKIDMMSYEHKVINSDLYLNESKYGIVLIDLVQSEFPIDKYSIELDIVF